jgi:hypothetical protein
MAELIMMQSIVQEKNKNKQINEYFEKKGKMFLTMILYIKYIIFE